MIHSIHTFDDVLTGARAGQAWALRELWNAHAARVSAYARSRGAEDPEQVANDVFEQAFRALAGSEDAFRGDEAGLRAWLFTITHRRCVDEARRRAVRPRTAGWDPQADPALDPRTWPSAEEDAWQASAEGRVREVLAALAPDQREVLLLRVVADLTVEQTAQVLGKTPGAVKQLQRRGLAAVTRLHSDLAVPA